MTIQTPRTSASSEKAAEQLALERIGIRVIRNRRWESPHSTPAA